MQAYEVSALIGHRDYRYRERWEMARFLGYITAQCNSKKRLRLTDIIKFDWDREQSKGDIANPDTPSAEQIERLQQMARMYEETLFADDNDKNTVNQ